jgi:drug/metabolite transporter (DMT)-like permease
MAAQQKFTGISAATLAALCWGSATVMSKGALDELPPIALLVIQLASSLAFLWTLLLARGVRIKAIADALRIAWLGLPEPGLAFVLALIGLAYTKAGIATLIASSEAPMIAALSALVLRERLSARFLTLSTIALAGLALATGVRDATSGGLLGDGLIALGTLVAALYVVLSSCLVVKRDPILVVACQQLVAGVLALALLPIEIAQQHGVGLDHLAASTWVLAAGSGIVQCTGLRVLSCRDAQHYREPRGHLPIPHARYRACRRSDLPR